MKKEFYVNTEDRKEKDREMINKAFINETENKVIIIKKEEKDHPFNHMRDN